MYVRPCLFFGQSEADSLPPRNRRRPGTDIACHQNTHTYTQVSRFCALQDAARFHAVCKGWHDTLGAAASPFYPEVPNESSAWRGVCGVGWSAPDPFGCFETPNPHIRDNLHKIALPPSIRSAAMRPGPAAVRGLLAAALPLHGALFFFGVYVHVFESSPDRNS